MEAQLPIIKKNYLQNIKYKYPPSKQKMRKKNLSNINPCLSSSSIQWRHCWMIKLLCYSEHLFDFDAFQRFYVSVWYTIQNNAHRVLYTATAHHIRDSSSYRRHNILTLMECVVDVLCKRGVKYFNEIPLPLYVNYRPPIAVMISTSSIILLYSYWHQRK